MVPAIKTASEYSRKRCIGLLATPGTIARSYTNQLIYDFAGDCHVIQVGSSEQVQMAEQYLRGKPVCEDALNNILTPFVAEEQKPDAVVLGCTHFPLLREVLQQFSTDIHWIDSGSAIARRVVSLLGGDYEPEGYDRFVYTGEVTQVNSLLPALKKIGFSMVQPFFSSSFCLSSNQAHRKKSIHFYRRILFPVFNGDSW